MNKIKSLKNYKILFISDGEFIRPYEYITAEQAAKISVSWANGVKLLLINGNAYASHQIKRIVRERAAEKEYIRKKFSLFTDTDVNKKHREMIESEGALINMITYLPKKEFISIGIPKLN